MVGPVQIVMLLAIGFVAGFVVTSTFMWEVLLPKAEARARAEGWGDGYRCAADQFNLAMHEARIRAGVSR